jgi:hypothetical protein
VEQEPPFTAVPAMEAIKIDYQYSHALARMDAPASGELDGRD